MFPCVKSCRHQEVMHVKCKHYLAHCSPPCKQCWPSDQSHEYLFSSVKALKTDKTKLWEPFKHNQKSLKQLKRGGGNRTACNVNSHATTDDTSFITAYLAPLSTLNIMWVDTDHMKGSWKMTTCIDQQCANKLMLNHQQSLYKETYLCQDKNGTLTWGHQASLVHSLFINWQVDRPKL